MAAAATRALSGAGRLLLRPAAAARTLAAAAPPRAPGGVASGRLATLNLPRCQPGGRGFPAVARAALSRPYAAAAGSSPPPPPPPAASAGVNVAPHPGLRPPKPASEDPNPVYSEEELDITPANRPVKTLSDRVAYTIVHTARATFDWYTGYDPAKSHGVSHWLRRLIFLETVAGVPGMVGGMLRHLHSLRTMRRDHGWIRTLLAEAENERMHLLTFMELRQPGWLFRATVLGAQGVMTNVLFLAYLVSPPTVHRMVGYLEEEAVRTYTHLLHDIDSGNLEEWRTAPAPQIAKDYWKLGEASTMRDVIAAVRADEACHSHVNHTLSELRADEKNPFSHGDYCWENDMSLESQKHLGDKADFTKPVAKVERKLAS